MMTARNTINTIVCLFAVVIFSVTTMASPASVKMHESFPNVENCAACHADPHQGQMSISCSSCHTTDTWQQLRSDFSHDPAFPLTGKHKQVRCSDCHIKGQFKNTPRECEVCHWQRRQDDPYETRLGSQCGQCHTPSGWAPANWNHTVETGFALAGAHRGLACDDCHKDLKFKSQSSRCISCHDGDYRSAENHASYPRDCAQCHSTSSWRASAFNHDTTGFPLGGAHAGLDCTACHTGDQYTGLSTDCFACHGDDYNATSDPAHSAAGFSTQCLECHNDTSWSSGQFNHDTTGFNLTEGHAGLNCSQCHTNNIYKGTPTDCFYCHADDYNSATDPNHAGSGYSTDCTLCHDTRSWSGAGFEHDPSDRECIRCHLGDYQQTRNPHHGPAGFSTSCDTCHDVNDWNSGVYDHAVNGYPLTGKHMGLSCDACHADAVYSGRDTACYACHQDDYTQTDDPNHVAAGFSGDCTLCHDTSGWENDFFNHDLTGYVLTGAHTTLDCRDCHTGNQYQGTPRECYACHREDYQSADDHEGLPTDCEQCHNTRSWESGQARQIKRNRRIRSLR